MRDLRDVDWEGCLNALGPGRQAWDTGPQGGTPLSYRPHLERSPSRPLSSNGSSPATGPRRPRALRAALGDLDLPALLRGGGLAEAYRAAVQERLAGP